jgi:hypothetical protein
MPKLHGIIRCDAAFCGYKEEVDDIGAHMNDKCPLCGTPLMDETDKAVFANLVILTEAGLISQDRKGEGYAELRIDSANAVREQVS